MKQHITKEQWDELEYKQKHNFVTSLSEDLEWEFFGNTEPKEYPSIGQMIEFLGDDWVHLTLSFGVMENELIYPANRNLCNDLWNAVKEKLKQ